MDFVALDFETASANANSACQLAVVCVSDSQIVDERCWLIRPPRLYFSPRNIAVHGIRPHQVRDAPTMEQLWDEIQPILADQVLIAHNARFDIGVLTSSLAAFDIACPSLEFTCTRLLARSAWPGRSRYGLKPLGDWLQIRFKHHDALEDARCCAKIALAAAKTSEVQDLESMEKLHRLSRGSYCKGKISSPRAIGRGRAQRDGSNRVSADRWGFPTKQAQRSIGSVEPEAVLSASAGQLPLSGKRIVLLGPMRGLSWDETVGLVTKLGGIIQSSIGASTSYVVACGTTLDAASQRVCQALAESHDDAGSDSASGIRVLSERQFRALLPGGKAASW